MKEKGDEMARQIFFPKKITREELNSLVDKAADIIRTATDYKFILVLLFLKRISDVWKVEFEEKKKELMKYLDEKKAQGSWILLPTGDERCQ